MSAAEFDLVPTGMTVFGFTPMNGFLNAGGPTNLLLAVGGCPSGPLVAGSMPTFDMPGDICFAPSAANGILGTVDCVTPVPNLWSADWRGYSNLGGPPCEDWTAVDDDSWGSIKALYR